MISKLIQIIQKHNRKRLTGAATEYKIIIEVSFNVNLKIIMMNINSRKVSTCKV